MEHRDHRRRQAADLRLAAYDRYTRTMRIALILAVALMATACGQTGSLYLPDDAVETPVEIRVPADDEEKKKDTQPPRG